MEELTTKEINIIGSEIARGVEYYESEIPDSDEKLRVWAGLKADYLRAKRDGKPMMVPNELDDDGAYLAVASMTPEQIKAKQEQDAAKQALRDRVHGNRQPE